MLTVISDRTADTLPTVAIEALDLQRLTGHHALCPLMQILVTESADGRVTRFRTTDLATGSPPVSHHRSRLSTAMVFGTPGRFLLCGDRLLCRDGVAPQWRSLEQLRVRCLVIRRAIWRRIERQKPSRDIIILPAAPPPELPRRRQQRMRFVLPQVMEAVVIVALPERVSRVFVLL